MSLTTYKRRGRKVLGFSTVAPAAPAAPPRNQCRQAQSQWNLERETNCRHGHEAHGQMKQFIVAGTGARLTSGLRGG